MNCGRFQSSREILQFDYDIRRSKNPRFSKRSYARVLGLSSGRLADLLSGRTPVTEKRALAIVSKLILSAEEKVYFLRLVENEKIARRTGGRNKSRASRHINFEEFSLISEWEYFPLMSLMEVSTFKSDRTWIAKKLGISEARLTEILDNLLRLKLVQVDGEGRISNTYRSMSTLTDIPSSVLKKANTDCILQAIEKMHEVDVLSRDVTSMTFPVDPGRIKEAKALIRSFKSKMADLMTGQETSEIYNLNIQFVPVSKLGV